MLKYQDNEVKYYYNGDGNIRPFISLIVTAYDRNTYLMDAINCAVNQTLDKDKYEIIVIKNFYDQKIDEFISKHKMKSIISSGIEGYYPYLAQKYASGQIIVFLDDDDLISTEKLKIIYDIFQDNNIGYYHNNYNVLMNNTIVYDKLINPPKFKTMVIKNNNKLKMVYFLEKKLAYANNSCIAIRKNLLETKKEWLKNQVANIDRFLFMAGLLSNLDLYIDSRILTTYRMHDKQTSALQDGDINILINRKINFINKSLPAFENMYKMARGSEFENYMYTRIINLKLAYNFWSFSKKYEIEKNPYILYLRSGNYFEFPRLFIYKSPLFLRKKLISLIYSV